MTGEDLFWEKNPNKALGQRYLLLTAGAPSEREGLAPPEINEAVHGIDDNAYLEKALPRVKLSDVNWRKQGGRGYSVFSLLALVCANVASLAIARSAARAREMAIRFAIGAGRTRILREHLVETALCAA